MSDQKEEIHPEQVPLKFDTDPEKLKVETNSTKVTFQNCIYFNKYKLDLFGQNKIFLH